LSPGMYMNSLIPMLILENDGLLEILEFRKIIEVESIKLAAQRISDEELEKLDEIMKSMFENKYDPKKFAKEDAYFHEVLVRGAKNSVLMKVNKIIEELLLSNQILIQEMIGPTLALKYHPMILDAVKKRDSILASKAMEEHIEVTIVEVKKLEASRKKAE
jgi:GntR family transcriptional regulator, transcriptional repressor for pyruvate dehydrogenase complex